MGDALDVIDDAPKHKVDVSAFFMQKNLVTKAEWGEVRAWGRKHGYTDLPEGKGKAADHPVQTVTWYDVVKWCNARSEKEGLAPCYFTGPTRVTVYRKGEVNLAATMVQWNAKGYRLPTEAEWEKAARGGLNAKRYPWGDSISHTQANFWNHGQEAYQSGSANYHPAYQTSGMPYTSPVGSFAANGYGLHDMTGNVWEWCWDWHQSYPAKLETDPRGMDSGAQRVVRGGSWYADAFFCRVAFRASYDPAHPFHIVGFRPVRSSVP